MFLLILILQMLFFLGKGTQATEVKSVQIIFRHGERPTETTWPPTSQLTEEGKKQMLDLGQFIRKRYPQILSSEFKPSEVFLISSDVERAISSANLVAYGIYKAFSVSSHWSNGNTIIPYEPIPVKTLLREIDIYLNHNFKCPRMLQLFASSVEAFLENLSEAADESIRKIGSRNIPGESGNTSLPINSGFDNTNIDEVPLNGLAMTTFVTIFSKYINALNLPLEACKLYGGSLLGWIVEGFEVRNSPKLTLYSAHDLPIYTIMKLLDIYDPYTLENPPFGSALLFELHHDNLFQRELVKIFYRNNSEEEPQELQFRACSEPCLLPNFSERTKTLIPVNYEQECLPS